jgi:hypothetical protein
MDLKSDIIKNAFSELQISGITVNPTADDNQLALIRMEQLAHEYLARNINIGYKFEESPSSLSSSGVAPEYLNAFSICVAQRMLSDFGKGMTPDPNLMNNYRAAVSHLSSGTATINPALPGSRFPRGSGNTRGWSYYAHYNRTVEQAPNEGDTIRLIVGDIDDYTEDFSGYLNVGEDVSSYEISADSGLTISNDSLTSPVVSYRVEAVGTEKDQFSTRLYQRVALIVTTSTGRKTTRHINFDVRDDI